MNSTSINLHRMVEDQLLGQQMERGLSSTRLELTDPKLKEDFVLKITSIKARH